MINNLNRETNDGQTFTEFRSAVETEKEKQEEFEKLKRLVEDLKKKQDEYAKEAQESADDINRLRKAVNETKTEKDLNIQFLQLDIDGQIQCLKR